MQIVLLIVSNTMLMLRVEKCVKWEGTQIKSQIWKLTYKSRFVIKVNNSQSYRLRIVYNKNQWITFTRHIKSSWSIMRRAHTIIAQNPSIKKKTRTYARGLDFLARFAFHFKASNHHNYRCKCCRTFCDNFSNQLRKKQNRTLKIWTFFFTRHISSICRERNQIWYIRHEKRPNLRQRRHVCTLHGLWNYAKLTDTQHNFYNRNHVQPFYELPIQEH